MNPNLNQQDDEARQFIRWVKDLMLGCGLKIECLNAYPGLGKSDIDDGIVRDTNRDINPASAARITWAIWQLHLDPDPPKASREQVAEFWKLLGKELNNGKPFAGNVSFEKFKELFFARLFQPPSPPPPQPSPRPATDAELLQLFSRYLGSEADACWQLVTRGINLGSGVNPLRLAQVYVNLETKTLVRPLSPQDHDRKLSALEVLFAENTHRVVLVGEPGSGKSTFFQFVLLGLTYKHSRALDAAFNFAGLEERIPAVLRAPQGKLVPFRVILRAFAPRLATGTKGTAEDVVKFFDEQLREAHSKEFKDAADSLTKLLERGLGFVLFDGLDEVPKPLLPAVKNAIENFAKGYQSCRIAVTCRVASYLKRNSEYTLAGFPAAHEIDSLSATLQKQLVRELYHEMEERWEQFRGEGAACANTLIEAIGQEPLQRMAANPFFLTAMVALHRPDKRLPDTSAELMDELVTNILQESSKRQITPGPNDPLPELASLLRTVPNGFGLLRARLELIAHKDREQGQHRASPYVDKDLLENRLVLAKNFPVQDLLHALQHRAGLVQSKDGENFEFAYRFGEFLAGCYLTNEDAWQNEESSFAQRARKLWQKQGDYARLVITWAAGFYVYVRKRKGPVRELVSALTPRAPLPSGHGLADLQLAAEIAHDVKMGSWLDEDVPDTADTVCRLRTRLEEVRDGTFDAKTRAKAASSIGNLGHLPAGVGAALDEDDNVITVVISGKRIAVPGFIWCGAKGEVSKGEADVLKKAFPKLAAFKLGEPKSRKDRAYGSFVQFDCTRIVRPFFISKYPVTVVQYQSFMDAGGYEREFADEARTHRLWTPDGWHWRTENKITGPENYDAAFQTPNHPRVGVSWFEARAYVAWLNSLEIRPHLARDLGLPEDKIELRLPAEAQWELAARWNRDEEQADDRFFPWRPVESKSPKKPTDEERKAQIEAELTERCNWHKSGIGHTSAVGLFPKGDADCGASDMAGNVWEWCQTKWGKSGGDWKDKEYNDPKNKIDDDEGEDARVLRGGSWVNDLPESLRAAFRYYDHPGYRYSHVGFRVVLVCG